MGKGIEIMIIESHTESSKSKISFGDNSCTKLMKASGVVLSIERLWAELPFDCVIISSDPSDLLYRQPIYGCYHVWIERLDGIDFFIQFQGRYSTAQAMGLPNISQNRENHPCINREIFTRVTETGRIYSSCKET